MSKARGYDVAAAAIAYDELHEWDGVFPRSPMEYTVRTMFHREAYETDYQYKQACIRRKQMMRAWVPDSA